MIDIRYFVRLFLVKDIHQSHHLTRHICAKVTKVMSISHVHWQFASHSSSQFRAGEEPWSSIPMCQNGLDINVGLGGLSPELDENISPRTITYQFTAATA